MKRLLVAALAVFFTRQVFCQDVNARIRYLKEGFERYFTLPEYDILTGYEQIIVHSRSDPDVLEAVGERLDAAGRVILERIRVRREESYFKYELLIDKVLDDAGEKKTVQDRYRVFAAVLDGGSLPPNSAVLDEIDALYAARYLFQPQEEYHVVAAGDCLWKLADRYYRNARLWPVIYRANRDTMRSPGNPNLIFPGEKLRIPRQAG
ncbi:MAG: LysM peptidoglycan-binding domain-containing protein [Treponema sp.]|jgi:hypothetical protein|nr:LysM peptidoglycan-binding domain-containing protein [Treponema sp.]